jgi:hypothetical protein
MIGREDIGRFQVPPGTPVCLDRTIYTQGCPNSGVPQAGVSRAPAPRIPATRIASLR